VGGIQLVIPSNPDFGYWTMTFWQGRGRQGVAKAYQGLGAWEDRSREGCWLDIREGGSQSLVILAQAVEGSKVVCHEGKLMQAINF